MFIFNSLQECQKTTLNWAQTISGLMFSEGSRMLIFFSTFSHDYITDDNFQ